MADHAHVERETIHETDVHTITTVPGTLITFLVLLALAFVQMFIGFSPLGDEKLILQLLITGTQASILSYFFMDLRQSDSLTWLCVGASFFWSGLLFLFTLTDYLTRHFASV